ncbi:ComF family protein [Streptococcus thoraltensis]
MKCQMCHKDINEKREFTSILLLKRMKAQTCKECLNLFEKIGDKHCSTCYKKSELEKCQDCWNWERKGNKVNHKSLYVYNQAMKAYFSVFKFQGDYLLAEQFSTDIRQSLKCYKDYTIVPIPISQQRMETRKFNQVEALLEAAQIPYQTLLEKKDIVSQTTKNKKERMNSEQVFNRKEGVDIPMKVLIVDDIYTTGHTIFLAKEMLKEIGVKEVASFSLAR